MLPGPYAGDYFNTLMICSSALAALYKAEKTGKGESIEPRDVQDALLAMGQYYLVDYLNEGIKWPRPGARNQNLCGIGEFACKDGFLGVCLYGVDQNKYFLEPSAWVICGAPRQSPRTLGSGCPTHMPRRFKPHSEELLP